MSENTPAAAPAENAPAEKRDFIRMPVECTVQLLDGERQIQGKCLDLSSTGMQIEATSNKVGYGCDADELEAGYRSIRLTQRLTTSKVAEALATCPGFTLIGGGETVAAAHQAGVTDRLGHVSTGGGASLEFLAGRELPGVAALER